MLSYNLTVRTGHGGSYLLLEIADGVIVGICEKVHDIRRSLDVVFKVIHQMRAISLQVTHSMSAAPSHGLRLFTSNQNPWTHLDLFGTSNCAKHDFRKPTMIERAVRDSSYDLQTAFHNRHTVMVPIQDKTGDVLARHLGKLPLENVLETSEKDQIFWIVVVLDHPESDQTCSFFRHSWSLASWSRILWGGGMREKVGKSVTFCIAKIFVSA